MASWSRHRQDLRLVWERDNFIRKAKKFFIDDKDRLYHQRPDDESQPQLVVDCDK